MGAPQVTTAVVGGAIGVGAVVAAPYAVGVIGFTKAGIAASSIAAKMMSVAAISNGGGIAAGGLVATLQSLGAAGVSGAATAAAGGIGAAAGWLTNIIR
ncbi:interferon alpha-inducible protein 27-like protein 2A isoform X1 [Mastacembelus armatus]|uniref:interferon alpha-inducible protein 27-like protein 2A isoform X1 n=1 Tax=Mastacembelus armatus TaxID=205130 RepID=UPI000E45CF36|nr:interferon alpha-inducible protein 27-like protein 2A isoform X1 [Mastacembelus armatus]